MITSDFSSWDPLESTGTVSSEILLAAKKREIKNILKSYVSNYDPFSELLQNAMDSTDKRFQAEAGSGYRPKVSVIIDIKNNYIQVIDNGTGFEPGDFRSFLAPNISFKSEGKTRGNKGVGITYIAYGFNNLEIETKNKHFEFKGRIRRGREWVEDSSGTVSRPLVEKVDGAFVSLCDLDQGTSFKISFDGLNIRPKSLSWYMAQSADQWKYLLCTRTPLGHISLTEMRSSVIECDITVFDKDGLKTKTELFEPRYMYPHELIQASQSLDDIHKAEEEAKLSGKSRSGVLDKFKQSNAIYKVYKGDELRRMASLTEEQIGLLQAYNATAYGYFTYSTDIWDQLNDRKANLRKGLRFLKGGLQLACNGMVQGDLITIPLTKTIGFQNQTHVVVHFDGAEPDLGRKGFQPELEEVASKIAVNVVKQLGAQRIEFLKGDGDGASGLEKDLKHEEWLDTVRDYERDTPLILKSDKFFLPTRKISIKTEPKSEQDVIVLFNQLLAGGVIRGINIISTSQSTKYDAAFRFEVAGDLCNYTYSMSDNPLGVYSENLNDSSRSGIKVLEYKHGLDGLIREFESGCKSEREVDLAVFWDMESAYKKDYSVTSYLDSDKTHKRRHHGLTHKLSSGNSHFEVICLKELVQSLNDPEESEKYQYENYSNEI